MLFFDNIKIKTYPCVQPWLPKPTQEIDIDHSLGNIYHEDFEGLAYHKYHLKQPINLLAASPFWNNKKNWNGKVNVIYQHGRKLDTYNFEANSYFILKNKRINTNGFVSTTFCLDEEGRVGLVFKFQNLNNYYIFEKIIEKDKQFYQIGYVKNSYNTIKVIPFDKSNKKWTKVRVDFKEYKFKISVKDDSPEAKYTIIYEGDNHNIDFGYIGFSSAGVSSGFSELTMEPYIKYFKDDPKWLPNRQLEVTLINITKSKLSIKGNEVKQTNSNNKLDWSQCVKTNIVKREKYCSETFGFSGAGMFKCHVIILL